MVACKFLAKSFAAWVLPPTLSKTAVHNTPLECDVTQSPA